MINMSETKLGRFSDQHESTEMGRAQQRAARAYGGDGAYYITHGSTGANAVALRTYKISRGRLRVLVARGAHHSIINEIMWIGGTLRFVRAEVDARFEAVLPPSPSLIEEALALGESVDLVVITTPTYEGLNARVDAIAEIVHAHGAALHADVAWGSHLGFHPSLPPSPIELGADTMATSPHKLAGAASQAALLVWRDGHVDAEAVKAAHTSYCTSSPNYVIAASLDQAIINLSRDGERAIGRAIALRDELVDRLTRALPALEILRVPAQFRDRKPDVNMPLDSARPADCTRLTVGLAGYIPTGFDVANGLMAAGIVPEKAGVQTVTVFVPIGAEDDLAARVSRAFIAQLAGRQRSAEQPRAALLPNPLMGLDRDWVIEPAVAVERSLVDGRSIDLGDAAGRTCAELVEAYPPGIPIGVPGFRLTPEAVAYLEAVTEAGGNVVSLKPSKIRILDENGSRR